MARVVLAMSGGVDSSVAAQLLLAAGHAVVGVFMRHGAHSPAGACATERSADRAPGGGPGSANRPGCCSAADAEDARRVADGLEIPFYAVNLQDEFREIIDYFVAEYTAGRTPNPCVLCNQRLKFGKLFEYADNIGAQFVATGHYARVVNRGTDAPELHRGIDAAKDQSYVLFGVPRERLHRMLLPVGAYHKAEIRRIAAELGLRVADKPDSQEICFVPAGRHDEFIRRQRPDVDTSGEIVTTDGRVVGRHPGIERFTVGQRKRLGVALGERYFVVRIDPATRRVVIGARDELARSGLTARDTSWLVDPPRPAFRCQAQIRYHAAPAPATAEILDGARLRITFDTPRYGIAPGQAVVCYEGTRVLGGGWIE